MKSFYQNCRRRAGGICVIVGAQAHDHSKMMQGATMSVDDSMEPVKAGDLTLSGAFTRATLPGAKVGGGYLSISKSSERT